MKRTILLLSALNLALFAGSSAAKLPAPSDEAKAAAAEAAAKSAHSDKVAAFKLCKSMDKVAADYHAAAKKAGKTVPAPVPTPPCSDPGPLVGAATDPKPPLEAAGAHSPPKPAASPPNTNTPHAAQSGETKK